MTSVLKYARILSLAIAMLLSPSLSTMAEGPEAPPIAENPGPGFFFDADAIIAAIEKLRSQPAFSNLPIDWTGIATYYREANGRGLFVGDDDFSPLGLALMQRLPEAVAAGMTMAPDLLLAMKTLPPPKDQSTRLQAEATIAIAFVATAIDAIDLIDDKGKRGAAILTDAARHADADKAVAFANRQWPNYYRFWSLRAALPLAIAAVERGSWPILPELDGKIEPGDDNLALPAIRQRLAASGDWSAPNDEALASSLYDSNFTAAIADFQVRHGLNPDGVIGRRTIEELNVDAATRLRQILASLAAMREETFEPRHVIANIPAQEVKVIDRGKVLFYSKAIVGRIDRPSPTLASAIRTIKLNPDWTAPEKIAVEDEARHEAANPGFLAAKGFTVYDSAGNEVDPSSIDWREVRRGNFPYTLRQAPGPENALGPAKLDFPNAESVYIHGTPAKALFAKQDRYFSSGCIRVEAPLDLAAFLLRDDPDWPRSRIDEVVASGKTVLIPMPVPVPVHLTYITTWVDEAGLLQFRKDMYKRIDLPEIPSGLVAIATEAAGQPGSEATKGKNE